MKSSKNLNLLFRIILIPAGLLLIMVMIIKAPDWLSEIVRKEQVPAPPVRSFGIIMPVGYTVHGIDVSKHQGDIDWKRVSAMEINGIRVSFAFIKATEGITRQDNMFEKNWKEAGRSGLLRGAYHFYYPSRDADKQADNFLSKVSLRKGDLPPVVDIEHSNGRKKEKICSDLQVFLNRLEKKYSVKPIIYTNINFFTLYLKGKFDSYPLWIAGYFDHDRFYNEFLTPWLLWQHSESGKVDGIRGKVDFNVFKGDIVKLNNMTLKK
jgi:lysozyme